MNVNGVDGGGAAVSYSVKAAVQRWDDDSGCNKTACIDPQTPLPPAHGGYTWRATLKPQVGRGVFTIQASTAASSSASVTIRRVTYGDVWFCSGQSNMDLETYYTFSADTLQQQIRRVKDTGVRPTPLR